MTILLSAINRDFAVQVSDRRVSRGDAILSDEYGKSLSLQLPGFSFTITFTGLAELRRYQTADFILDTLFAISKTVSEPTAVFERIAAALTHRFNTYMDVRGLQAEHRRLMLTIVGYDYRFQSPRGVMAEMANAGDPPGAFSVRYFAEPRPGDGSWVWMGAYSNGTALRRDRIEAIRATMRRRVPATIVLRRLEAEILAMADDHRSGVTIGKQTDHILLFSDRNKPPVGGHSSMRVKPEAIMPAGIMLGPPGQAVAFKGAMIEAVGAGARSLTVPKVHRNQPCPCGSRSKYRDCHGPAMPAAPC